jgi:hypothetical protein
MKIIQSFWAAKQDPIKDSFGWNRPRYHWLSWVLSVNQLAKYYDVELYTDSVGYDILIKKLELPYAKVHLVLDELDQYPKGFWALPKIKTYALQEGPFLHIDGDVFIWEAFPKALLEQGLITQNLEITTDYYHSAWELIEPKLKFIPEEMNAYREGKINLACNMGIVGGNDLSFFKQYTNKSLEFVEKNISLNLDQDKANFNVFFEQVLFYLMAHKDNKQSAFLINEVSKDNDYKGMGDFHRVPIQKTYLHLLGHYKRDRRVCKQLENYVLRFYPEFFEKVVRLMESDFPYFKNQLSEYSFTLQENEQVASSSLEDSKSDAEELLRRDLISVTEPIVFLEHIEKQVDFELDFLRGFRVIQKEEGAEEDKFIEIQELEDQNSYIPIDDVDEMIFYQIRHTKNYTSIMKNMLSALDEDAMSMAEQFLEMIKDRILFFITFRVLRISIVLSEKP